MSSKTFAGVWFTVYAHDHLPPHVHGQLAGVEVLIDLLTTGVRLSTRRKPIRPENSKRSDVKKILRVATDNAADLMELWRRMHG